MVTNNTKWKRWDKIRFINWMSGSWGFCKVLSLHPQTVCRSVVNVAYRKDFVVHSSWLKVMTMKIPSSLRVIFPCCLSRMEAVRDKWMIPIRGACKVPKDPDRQNWMTDEVGFWNLHRLTMTATSFFWGDLQRHGRTVALWPSDFLSHDACSIVQPFGHPAVQSLPIATYILAMQQPEGDVSYPNLLQQPIAPVAAVPGDWDPQEGGAQARLGCMNSVMLRHLQ